MNKITWKLVPDCSLPQERLPLRMLVSMGASFWVFLRVTVPLFLQKLCREYSSGNAFSIAVCTNLSTATKLELSECPHSMRLKSRDCSSHTAALRSFLSFIPAR